MNVPRQPRENNNAGGKFSVGEILSNELGDFVDAIDRLERKVTAGLLTIAATDKRLDTKTVVAIFKEILKELDK